MEKNIPENMPITKAVYGKQQGKPTTGETRGTSRQAGSRIYTLLPEATMKKIARRYPRCRKYYKEIYG